MLTQEQLEQLKAPFPDDAITEDRSRGFALSSVKAAYIIERLNDVFGVCGIGWRYVHSPVETTGKEVTTEVALQYSYENAKCGPIYWDGEMDCWAILDTPTDWSEPIFAHGGKKMGGGGAPLTDAKKSAVTDGLTKAASMIGVAHHIFKGLGKQGVREQKPKVEKKKEEKLATEWFRNAPFMMTPEEITAKGKDLKGYAQYIVDRLKGVEYNGEQIYAKKEDREALYEELFGESDFWANSVLGWLRLLETYAVGMGQVSDDEFEEKQERAKEIVRTGVEHQLDWTEAVEKLNAESE